MQTPDDDYRYQRPMNYTFVFCRHRSQLPPVQPYGRHNYIYNNTLYVRKTARFVRFSLTMASHQFTFWEKACESCHKERSCGVY